MKLSIFTTMTYPQDRQDAYVEAIASYLDLADEVVIVDGCTSDDFASQAHKRECWNDIFKLPGSERINIVHSYWPEEFEWDYIGKQFQKGYEACTGDWVIRADLDYIFHEKDMPRIRLMLDHGQYEFAFCFWKYQFLLVDRYQIKSRPVIAVNKKMYGDNIHFDGGGDLCQPTLNGVVLVSDDVPEIKVPVYNYDFCFKDEKTIRKDFPRFSRAWYRTFKNYGIGGLSEEESFDYFKHMMVGRYTGRGHEEIKLKDHPKYIQGQLRKLAPNKFGHSMFGWVDQKASYYEN